LQQQFEKGVIAACQPVAGLARRPQQRLDFFFAQTLGPRPLLTAEKTQRGRGIGGNEFLVLGPTEEFLERLHLAVDAGGPQLFRTDEVLAVAGQIDRSDPAQANGFAAALLDPGAEAAEVGGVSAPGRQGEIGGLQTAREVPQHAIPHFCISANQT
jgi:hypothetical protein